MKTIHLFTEEIDTRVKVSVLLIPTRKIYTYVTSKFIEDRFKKLNLKSGHGMSSLNYLKRNSTLEK